MIFSIVAKRPKMTSLRQMWRVVIMSLLLLLKCVFFLWQPTVNAFLLLQNTFSCLCVQVGGEAGDDYWAEDFDSDKNCQQEEKIIKLSNVVGAHDLNKDSIVLFSGEQKPFSGI